MAITGASDARPPQAITGEWVRYIWDLRRLPPSSPLPSPYRTSDASPRQFDEVLAIVVAAYASDAIWAPVIDRIQDRMRARIAETLGALGAAYVAVTDGAEMVAVSGLAREHWTDQNLLTGICVLPRHQRRGIGSWLLGESLRRLREMGLDLARVYTESGSLADRKIYALYGGRRESHVQYPGASAARSDLRHVGGSGDHT
jgi:ribosomal protein S18 acetylase RimI-like enzyme